MTTKKTTKKAAARPTLDGMRHAFTVLLCPHEWGVSNKTKVRSSERKKPFDAEVSTCAKCGTVRAVEEDGVASLYPPQK